MFTNIIQRYMNPRAPTPEPRSTAAHIDELMAQPIKQPPQITIFGDDSVTGINPAPAQSA